MANRRIERLNEQLRREISDILRRTVRDPRVGVPTVTRVETTSDLWMARVFVRLIGPEAAEALAGLEAAAPFVRRELAGVMRLRRVPELRFEVDRTLEHASRIEELLREVRPAGSPEEGEERGDGGAEGDAGEGDGDTGDVVEDDGDGEEGRE